MALLTSNDYKKLDRLKEAEVATSSSALVDTNGLETVWVAGVAEMAAGSSTRKTSAEVAGVASGASTLVNPDGLEAVWGGFTFTNGFWESRGNGDGCIGLGGYRLVRGGVGGGGGANGANGGGFTGKNGFWGGRGSGDECIGIGES